MKYFLLLLLSLMHLLPYTVSSQNTKQLKVISYNVWNGFDWGKDKDRESAMVRWLVEQNADVIGFQELNDFTQEKLEKLAKQWGHPYAILLKENGYPVGISSKTPLESRTKMLGGLWHGMLHVHTVGIDFLVVHLSPHDWQFRRREADIISNYLEHSIIKTGQEKLIVLGDFNAQSPFDGTLDQNNPGSLQRSRESDSLRFAAKQENAYQTLRKGEIDYSVMAKFLSIPLIDVVQRHIPEEKRQSYNTAILTDLAASPRPSTDNKRIDYILVSTFFEKKCLSAEIINYGIPVQLSDHFPVVANFEWQE